MRTTHTFVLRLLIDSDEPHALRGALHSIADDADYSFADAQALLALLRQMTGDANAPGKDFRSLGDLESLKNQEGGRDAQDS